MAALEEQETTITVGRLDKVARVWTADLRHLRRLRKLVSTQSSVRKVRGGEDWAEFEVDLDYFYLFSAFRRKRTVPEAERAARAERLATARDLRRSSLVDEALRGRDG